MSDFYIPPKNVKSPKGRISGEIKVLRDGGAGDWSLAKLIWDKKDTFGIRWNGNDENKGVGNPQSRGVPTWFILPSEICKLIEANMSVLCKDSSNTTN